MELIAWLLGDHKDHTNYAVEKLQGAQYYKKIKFNSQS